MRKSSRLIVVCLALALVFLLGWQFSRAQTVGEEYYHQHGHWVRGEFLTYYQAVPNPEILYGFPITEAFLDESTGLWVQYFDNVRMELHPDDPNGQSVHLTEVGEYLYNPVEGTAVVDDSGDCRAYPPNDLLVCRSFLDFYEANGGVDQFGPPISSFKSLNGLVVQYFVKARFEWRPEYPAARRVKVSNFGKQFFDSSNENSQRQLPVDFAPGNIVLPLEQSVQKLVVRAFPHHAVTGFNADQTIYVIVQDQKRAKIESASVEAIVKYPSGIENKFLPQIPETNEEGVVKITFPVSANLSGLVEVTIKATYRLPSGKSVVGNTITSFRIWR